MMKFGMALLGFLVGTPVAIAGPDHPHVLFIMADDLKADLGCYGSRLVQSPNLDRLARKGVRFDRAYCQYPVCNPSRTSLLSGLRPAATGVVDNVTPTRQRLGDSAIMLPQWFRQRGYRTLKVGKIFHTGDEFEDPASWSEDVRERGDAKGPPASQILRKVPSGMVLNVDDAETWDGFVARKAATWLEDAPHSKQPLFIAVGFRRPHTPYIAPARYFDLYPLNRMARPVEPLEHLEFIPRLALTYKLYEKRPTESQWPMIRQAYHASVSFMDAQVGILLDALDRLDLWEDTIVVFASDHGYQLGEHGGLWHKMTLFEPCDRVPLIVAAPGKKRGTASPRLVELVDLYPSLAELCGIGMPTRLDGRSFAPLLSDPEQPWKDAVWTVVSRANTFKATERLDPASMGRSVRTEHGRYTEWPDGTAELYDHDHDPNEWRNLINDPAHAELRTRLQARLRAMPSQALP